jgi:hypothetical protein
MKTSILTYSNNRYNKLSVIFLILLICLFSKNSIGAEPLKLRISLAQTDSVIVTKTKVSKKYKVRIYPNTTHEVLFFTAAGEEGKVYELFVFSIEGKLIKRIQVRNRETTLLKTFEKGSYIYEVFSNDERIENGNMTIQ